MVYLVADTWNSCLRRHSFPYVSKCHFLTCQFCAHRFVSGFEARCLPGVYVELLLIVWGGLGL